jgi:hypothetical protein
MLWVSDPHGSALIWVILIRIGIKNADPDPGGQKWPTKIEKNKEISCFEALDHLDVLFWGLEGFSCSMGALYGA